MFWCFSPPARRKEQERPASCGADVATQCSTALQEAGADALGAGACPPSHPTPCAGPDGGVEHDSGENLLPRELLAFLSAPATRAAFGTPLLLPGEASAPGSRSCSGASTSTHALAPAPGLPHPSRNGSGARGGSAARSAHSPRSSSIALSSCADNADAHSGDALAEALCRIDSCEPLGEDLHAGLPGVLRGVPHAPGVPTRTSGMNFAEVMKLGAYARQQRPQLPPALVLGPSPTPSSGAAQRTACSANSIGLVVPPAGTGLPPSWDLPGIPGQPGPGSLLGPPLPVQPPGCSAPPPQLLPLPPMPPALHTKGPLAPPCDAAPAAHSLYAHAATPFALADLQVFGSEQGSGCTGSTGSTGSGAYGHDGCGRGGSAGFSGSGSSLLRSSHTGSCASANGTGSMGRASAHVLRVGSPRLAQGLQRGPRGMPATPPGAAAAGEGLAHAGSWASDLSVLCEASRSQCMEALLPRPLGGSLRDPTEVTCTTLIGKGSFGAVWEGTWQGKAAAIKVMPIHLPQAQTPTRPLTRVASAVGTPPAPGCAWACEQQQQQEEQAQQEQLQLQECMQRVGEEASLCICLRHPNIVSTYTAFIESHHKLPTGRKSQRHSNLCPGSRPTSGSQLERLPGACESLDQSSSAFIVMELCTGGSLRAALDHKWLLQAQDPQTHMSEVLPLAWEICSAVAYLHAHGIMHGDLKAANVLLAELPPALAAAAGRRFSCKVGDFGHSRLMEVTGAAGHGPTPRSSRTGALAQDAPGAQATECASARAEEPGGAHRVPASPGPGGGRGREGSSFSTTRTRGACSELSTPTHMAPELVMGDVAAPGMASDVYALGVVLWELCTGERPYHKVNHIDLLRAKISQSTSQVLAFPDSCAPELVQLCHQCWEDVQHRPSMAEVLGALRAMCLVWAPHKQLDLGAGQGGGLEGSLASKSRRAAYWRQASCPARHWQPAGACAWGTDASAGSGSSASTASAAVTASTGALGTTILGSSVSSIPCMGPACRFSHESSVCGRGGQAGAARPGSEAAAEGQGGCKGASVACSTSSSAVRGSRPSHHVDAGGSLGSKASMEGPGLCMWDSCASTPSNDPSKGPEQPAAACTHVHGKQQQQQQPPTSPLAQPPTPISSAAARRCSALALRDVAPFGTPPAWRPRSLNGQAPPLPQPLQLGWLMPGGPTAPCSPDAHWGGSSTPATPRSARRSYRMQQQLGSSAALTPQLLLVMGEVLQHVEGEGAPAPAGHDPACPVMAAGQALAAPGLAHRRCISAHAPCVTAPLGGSMSSLGGAWGCNAPSERGLAPMIKAPSPAPQAAEGCQCGGGGSVTMPPTPLAPHGRVRSAHSLQSMLSVGEQAQLMMACGAVPHFATFDEAVPDEAVRAMQEQHGRSGGFCAY